MLYLGLISSKSAVGDNKGAYRIFKVAISIFGFIGFLGTSIMFLYADMIATNYLGIPEANLTIIALAPSIFIVSITSVLRGYFNGREDISVTANSQTFEQVIKTGLTIVVVEVLSRLSNKNTSVMAAGAAITATMASSLSVLYLFIFYIKSKKNIWKDVITSTNFQKESINKIAKNILGLSIPIALTALISTANRTIDAFSIVNTITKSLGAEEAKLQYGILTGKVEGLVALPYSFNIAFAITLIPTISAAQAVGDMEKAHKRINFSILATILICLPCTAVFFVFSGEILKLLFPNAYLGATMLKLSSLSIVFVAITQTIGGVLQGIKKAKETAIAATVGAIVKLVLNLSLIPFLNINGAIIATIISHIVTFGISFYYIKKYIKIKFKIIKFIFKPAISTFNMVFSSVLIHNALNSVISTNLSLIVSLIIGGVIYVFSIIVLRTLSKEEICMLPYCNKFLKKRRILSKYGELSK